MSCPHAYVLLQRSIVVSKSSTFGLASWSSVPCTLSYLHARSGPSNKFMKTPQSKPCTVCTQSNSVTQSHMFTCMQFKQNPYTIYSTHACSTQQQCDNRTHQYCNSNHPYNTRTRQPLLFGRNFRRTHTTGNRLHPPNGKHIQTPSTLYLYTNNDKNLLLRVSFYNKCACKQISAVLLCVRLNYRERMRTNGDVLERFGSASN